MPTTFPDRKQNLNRKQSMQSFESNELKDAPVLPRDRNILELLKKEKNLQTLHSSASLKIFLVLAEDKVFLQGFNKSQWEQKNPAMLRGDLIVKIMKPIKLKSVTLKFDGYSITEWPEGMPSLHNSKKPSGEYSEMKDIVHHAWPFYKHDDMPTKHHKTVNSASFLKSCSGCNMFYPLDIIESNGSNVRLSRTLSNASSIGDDFNQHGLADNNNNNNNNNNSSGNHLASNNNGSHQNKHQQQSHRSLSPLGGFFGGMTRRRTSTVTSMDSFNLSEMLSSTLSNNSTGGNDTLVNGLQGGNSSSGAIANQLISSTNGVGPNFIFQPGYYVYSFEQCVPLSYPESIQSTFGHVSYYLNLDVERVGAFKSNIHAKREIQLIRTPSDSSVEETEPISIVRDWENALHYDILIASKDIVLNAFLPISFCFTPIDKVNLHRIRVYLTETMEYYAKGKKVHRLEPTKKILLSEYKAPPLKGLSPEAPKTKAKNLGNILSDNPADPKNGYIAYKEIDLQVYIPEFLNANTRIHPDTACQQIKSNHWIKLGLRLSRYVDGKLKHFEISIDSPIHVLGKYCTHGNTLLPSYESHMAFAEALGPPPPPSTLFNQNDDVSYNLYDMNSMHLDNHQDDESSSFSNNAANALSGLENFGTLNVSRRGSVATDILSDSNTSNTINLGYHTSNIYFPKEIVNSPMMSPNVEPLNETSAHHHADNHRRNSVHTGMDATSPAVRPLRSETTSAIIPLRKTRSKTLTSNHQPTFKHANTFAAPMNKSMSLEQMNQIPEMQSNIYSPDKLMPEFMSPQALPFGSPLSSPVMGPIQFNNKYLSPSASFVNLNEDLIHSDVPPPPFEERESKNKTKRKDSRNSSIVGFSQLPESAAGSHGSLESHMKNHPPSYMQVLKNDGIVDDSSLNNNQTSEHASHPRGIHSERNHHEHHKNVPQGKPTAGNTSIPALKFTSDGDSKNNVISNSKHQVPHLNRKENVDPATPQEEDFGSAFMFRKLLPNPSQQNGYNDISALLLDDQENDEIDPKQPLSPKSSPHLLSVNKGSTAIPSLKYEGEDSHMKRSSQEKHDRNEFGDDIADIRVRSSSSSPVRSLLQDNHETTNTPAKKKKDMSNSANASPFTEKTRNTLNGNTKNPDESFTSSSELGDDDVDDYEGDGLTKDIMPLRTSTDLQLRVPLLNGLSRQNTQQSTNNPFSNVFSESKESVLLSNFKAQNTDIDLKTLVQRNIQTPKQAHFEKRGSL